MIRFIIRRLGALIALFFGMIVVMFLLTHVIPADPARIAVGPQATQQSVDAMRHKMGLDKPLIVQMGIYVWGVLHLNFGNSVYDGQPVFHEIMQYAPATIELAIVATVLSVAFGLAMGILSAVYQNSIVDSSMRVFAIIGRAIAPFWLAILLQIVFFGRLNWFPSGTQLSLSLSPPTKITGMYLVDSLITLNWQVFFNSFHHIVLPAVALGLGGIADTSRMMRATMLIELRREYPRTARAKGLSEWSVQLRHVVRNAINPVVTVIGIRFGYLLAGTILIEAIFQWPGLGRYALLAIENLDFPALIGVTLFVVVAFAIVNLFVDILYGYLDPRIRYA
ncbi:MAG TPA: ABC transporter permease [Chloroflexota bacterium]|nr:ABC transporter permease [Chloroflexota bacterium]